MLHHVSLPVADLKASIAMYDAALAGLGYRRVCTDDDFAGYGTNEGEDKFALMHVDPSACAGRGFHLAFIATSQKAVQLFYEAALAHGAKDNGVPGLRSHYGPTYYAAFIIDLDGHHIEAVYK